MESGTLRFDTWLTDQQHRADAVGELARAPGMLVVDPKPSKRAPDEHRNWADVVTRFDDPRHIPAFNDAWQEFLLARRAADDAAG